MKVNIPSFDDEASPVDVGASGAKAPSPHDTADEARNNLLTAALSAAVPMWILELSKKPFDYVRARAAVCGDHIAEHGDVILFKSSSRENKKHGGTAEAFNRLAEGLACMAFCPGGVKFADMHFEATHPEVSK